MMNVIYTRTAAWFEFEFRWMRIGRERMRERTLAIAVPMNRSFGLIHTFLFTDYVRMPPEKHELCS